MKTIAALFGLLALQDGVSPDLLEYQPTSQVSGSLELGPGSGLDNVLTRWGERMKQHHPDLRGARPLATTRSMPELLIDGTIRFGILGRRWTDTEVEDFRGHWGFFPTWFAVGGDALSIVVNRENSISGLLVEQVDAMFSSTCRRGAKAVVAWGEVGLQGEDWKTLPVRCVTPGKGSRARSAFQQRALLGGAFREGVKDLAGTEEVLRTVAEDPYAVGFVSGLVKSEAVRVVPLIPAAGARAVDPNPESILGLSYPLGWRIYVAVRKVPGTPVDPEVGEFVKLILSRDGQEILADEGLVPVTGRFAKKELLKLK
jgi:phosphate transport system substrate-binding protein